eukprot:scaffold59666_cov45-Phaeocystis_antarctica.AAC.2
MKSDEGMDSDKSTEELAASEQTHAAGHVTPSVLQSRLHSTVLISTAVLRQTLLGGAGCSACAGRAAALVALASRLSMLWESLVAVQAPRGGT